MNILLITEQRASKWNKTSFETLAAAQQLLCRLVKIASKFCERFELAVLR